MTYRYFSAIVPMALSGALLLGQVNLNPNPSRVIGHPRLTLSTTNPNLVEGRELYSPQGIAVDTSANPSILYVADSGNDRVLAWNDAARFSTGAPADFIIGQKDPYSTFPQGPGKTFSTGLSSPTGLAVKDGNLYVVDTGNNRILRFPRPATQADPSPDMVIGQPNFTSGSANQGGTAPTERTLNFATTSAVYRSAVAFDAAGNLWASDPGNSRVLRYPAAAINRGENAPAADFVLGQVDFVSVPQPLPAVPASQQIKDRLQVPAALAFDSAGRLYVSDALSRVLVFAPPFSLKGMLANRVMGVLPADQPVPQATIDRTGLLDPEGIFMAGGNNPGVLDALSHRIVLYPPFEEWPDESAAYSPPARAVLGQLGDFSSRKANHGQAEASENTLNSAVAAAAANGELYVADSGNHRVLALPQQGDSFGPATRVLGQGCRAGDPACPAGFSPFAGNSPNLIEGREFAFLLSTSRGSVVDAAIAVDQSSDPPHLYVADVFNNRVLGFNDVRKVRPGDRADLVIGQPDLFRGLCNYPSNDPSRPTASSLCLWRTDPRDGHIISGGALAVDSGGNLWVADTGNGRVLRFSTPFARQGTLPQADLVLGQPSLTASIFDPSARTMAAPSGLAFAGNNGLLVSDQVHNRVLFFPRSGGGFTSGMAATKVYGQPNFSSVDPSAASNPEDNRLRAPRQVAADTDARPYIADSGNSRILIFDQVGNTPAADARAVVTLAGLNTPRSVYVSPQSGEFWVTDSGTGRLLHYPRFDQLIFGGFQPNGGLQSAAISLAVAEDQSGDLLVADSTSRVAIYYPTLTAVNGAHFLANRPLTPGVVASVYPAGNRFGTETKVFTDLPNPLPLPTELADIQVLVNDTPAPLYFVSPQQINLFVPMNAPTSGTAEFQVLRKSTGQILGSGPVQMNVASPALFTANASGTGQAAALNQDNTVNSATNAAAPGTVVQFFGTGQGVVSGAPPDGDIPQGLVTTAEKPRVILGSCFIGEGTCGGSVEYSGLAPGLVGVWQINIKLPDLVQPDPATGDFKRVPVIVYYKNIPSNGGDPQRIHTTIAVKQ